MINLWFYPKRSVSTATTPKFDSRFSSRNLSTETEHVRRLSKSEFTKDNYDAADHGEEDNSVRDLLSSLEPKSTSSSAWSLLKSMMLSKIAVIKVSFKYLLMKTFTF